MGLNIWRERDELRAQLEESEARAQSLLKEFDRHRRHARDELESADRRARIQATAAFLPVYDQLALALSAEGASEAFLSGVRMTQQQFLRVLREADIQRMDCLGKPFDPRFHEAVEHVEQPDAESGIVVEVLREGFFSEAEGMVVRHAMVKVAK
ncbi:MAG: nucleotide exchange factor GrpE [Clostridia bacterium]|nr:nucleotide exchange factor GrpE [Clostridia bacterium]